MPTRWVVRRSLIEWRRLDSDVAQVTGGDGDARIYLDPNKNDTEMELQDMGKRGGVVCG